MRKVAVFTVVRDEGRMLQKWLNYYGPMFGYENTYILDNDTKDGSTHNLPCSIRGISCGEAYNNSWLCENVKEFQKELLSRGYDYVVFADCDEFLWHPDGLNNYIQTTKHPDIRATGYELIHMPDVEPPIDYERPIMSQRSFWFRLPLYDKTLISNHPMDWKVGLHKTGNGSGFQDNSLLLIHLHRFDFNETLRRHERALNLPWHEPEVQKGFHHARSIGDEYSVWYFKSRLYRRNYRDIPESALPPIESIPKHILDGLRVAF
jgi:hypothetical protein